MSKHFINENMSLNIKEVTDSHKGQDSVLLINTFVRMRTQYSLRFPSTTHYAKVHDWK